jgi:hypothetical protein
MDIKNTDAVADAQAENQENMPVTYTPILFMT